MSKYGRISARVDLDAIRKNLYAMREKLKPETKIVAVVKTDGYGHGACAIGRYLEREDCLWGYAVATAEEALELKASGLQKPVLILGYTFSEDYEELIRNDVRLTVISMDMAKEISRIAGNLGKSAYIHIKMDTGMHRIGYDASEESMEEIAAICGLPHLVPEGIFTHFARADEADKGHAMEQYELFCRMIDMLKERGISFSLRHCANSAAIMELPDVQMDMVRAGITLYGLWPSSEMDPSFPLHPAMSLHSHIVAIRDLPEGSAISYGGTFVTERASRVATIPVGYGDGYARSLSNRGYVLIRGRRAPILGRVCMDQFMVDVTDIPGTAEGDECILFGEQEGEILSVEEVSELAGSFNYEFVCDVGRRVPRVFYQNGKAVETKDYYPEY